MVRLYDPLLLRRDALDRSSSRVHQDCQWSHFERLTTSIDKSCEFVDTALLAILMLVLLQSLSAWMLKRYRSLFTVFVRFCWMQMLGLFDIGCALGFPRMRPAESVSH